MSNTLSKNLKKLRKLQQLSLSELARQADVSKAYLSQLESGQSTTPSAEILFKIAGVLGVTIASLSGKTVIKAEEETRSIPPSLENAIKKYPPLAEHRNMLAHMQFRGKYPKTEDDWFLLFNLIKKTILSNDEIQNSKRTKAPKPA